MKMLADQAVHRMQGSGTILHYDHHFEPGADERMRFWEAHRTAFATLPGNIRIQN